MRRKEQAARVAWRVVKDWLEAQLAMIEAGMVDLEQVFLAYAQNPAGETIYEVMRSQRFSNLLLEQPKTAQLSLLAFPDRRLNHALSKRF